MLKDRTVRRVDHQPAALLALQPPTGRNVELLPVGCDRRTIAAHFVALFPNYFVRLEIKTSQKVIRCRVISPLRRRVRAKSANPFFKTRQIDAPHKAMPIVNIEDDDSGP